MLSAPPAETSRSPSGLNVTPSTGWSCAGAMQPSACPLAASHTRTLPSWWAVARTLPIRLNAMPYTGPPRVEGGKILVASGRIPDPHGPVPARRGDPPAVGDCQATPVRGSLVTAERHHLPARVGVPDLRSPVPARRDDPPAVGAVREPDHRVTVAFQSEDLPAPSPSPARGVPSRIWTTPSALPTARRWPSGLNARLLALRSTMSRGERLLPRPQVPDLHDQVIPGAGQSLRRRHRTPSRRFHQCGPPVFGPPSGVRSRRP